MIRLDDIHIAEIRKHGEAEFPMECCGLLIGQLGENDCRTVAETFPIVNAREDDAKHNRFLIGPRELMLGERHAHKMKMDVIGFYHSHPDHPARPSAFDLEHAWPVYSYIIVSVLSGVADDLRSWQMVPDRTEFKEEEILKGTRG